MNAPPLDDHHPAKQLSAALAAPVPPALAYYGCAERIGFIAALIYEPNGRLSMQDPYCVSHHVPGKSGRCSYPRNPVFHVELADVARDSGGRLMAYGVATIYGFDPSRCRAQRLHAIEVVIDVLNNGFEIISFIDGPVERPLLASPEAILRQLEADAPHHVEGEQQ